jgi:hypothetical protein
MKWYFPSWNGDFRIEKKDDKTTSIEMVHPTAKELQQLGALGVEFKTKGWVDDETLWKDGDAYRDSGTQSALISAPLSAVAPVVHRILRTGKATLTAIVMKDGKVETIDGAEVGELAEKAEKKGKAGASVKRPTPSCPQCFVDAVSPATEVLLSMCDDEQHEMWSRDRRLICYGNLSGHRYVVSHRNTKFAATLGKICLDADDGTILRFHDWSVPPEEEVLATKLILEHREHWLRNEATSLGNIPGHYASTMGRYKNPFGGFNDGVPDTTFVTSFGAALKAMLISQNN